MSRATWYRCGKPDESRMSLPPFHKAFASDYHVSERTAFRATRVLDADPDLFHAVMAGAGKWGQAEWLILHPELQRKWREANGLPWPIRSSARHTERSHDHSEIHPTAKTRSSKRA